jgi:heterodisulfide reductase subunit A
VVAACTPKTHEPLFQETLINAGLNKYLFEMANIRNQDSWVHKNNPELATRKAKDLVRMAVAKVALMQPLKKPSWRSTRRPWSSAAAFRHDAARSLAARGTKPTSWKKATSWAARPATFTGPRSGDDVQEKLAE